MRRLRCLDAESPSTGLFRWGRSGQRVMAATLMPLLLASLVDRSVASEPGSGVVQTGTLQPAIAQTDQVQPQPAKPQPAAQPATRTAVMVIVGAAALANAQNFVSAQRPLACGRELRF